VVRHHRQRPLSGSKACVGRQLHPKKLPQSNGLRISLSEMFSTCPTFKPPLRLADDAREKCLHRTEQIGTEPSALLFGAAMVATRQHLVRQFMREVRAPSASRNS